ncbi:hypothetical protein B_252 [Cronobacter phage vB_CsaM_leB]|uniref:Uncharacterized protein n=1 Tax=Cronobacter phage vB_CsaM_leB TaxID=1885242 RepID=A0A1W5N0P7_9CAUD|nr:hypothetical protein HWB00_gp252 [Cronobacter phage vB_CsaM_leB]AOG16378.1 hypothetical protein B_252 [Cronobacter phage vB_CsaM_leB]UGO54430.1 hypothetical protein BANACH_47 [Cronobacter phage vB_CsaD_Banach]
MKLWSKSKFELSDPEAFAEMVNDLWGPDAPRIMLTEVRFPIQITDCDRAGAYAFTDANGKEYNADSFGFSPNERLFNCTDREKFFKKVNYNANPVTAEPPVQEKNEAQQLLDCSHLLGRIYVDGKLVTKPGDLEKFLRKARETTLKDTEKRYDTVTANLQRLSGELKVLRGE